MDWLDKTVLQLREDEASHFQNAQTTLTLKTRKRNPCHAQKDATL
jgi:hypothetical protein